MRQILPEQPEKHVQILLVSLWIVIMMDDVMYASECGVLLHISILDVIFSLQHLLVI